MAWTDEDRIKYFKTVYPLIQDLASRTGLSPVFLLAQTMFETGWGQHTDGNNLFGVKADPGWKTADGKPGPFVTRSTHEERNGRMVGIVDKFRKYSSFSRASTTIGVSSMRIRYMLVR